MKLLKKSDKQKLIDNHNKQDGTKSFKAVVKLFNPSGIGTWFLSELNPKDNIAFGLCCLTEEELGYVSLEELKSLKTPFGLCCLQEEEVGYVSLEELKSLKTPLGLGIERDLYFKPNKKTLDECRTKAHP